MHLGTDDDFTWLVWKEEMKEEQKISLKMKGKAKERNIYARWWGLLWKIVPPEVLKNYRRNYILNLKHLPQKKPLMRLFFFFTVMLDFAKTNEMIKFNAWYGGRLTIHLKGIVVSQNHWDLIHREPVWTTRWTFAFSVL